MNKYLVDAVTFPSDALHGWRTDGAHGLWTELAERTVFRLARSARYNLYERDLSTIPHVPPPDGVLVRMLEPHEHVMLDTLMTRRRRASLARGAGDRVVFAAFRDAVLVGYSWWTPDFDSALDFSPLTLPRDAIFHGYVHVDLAERRLGTGSALFSAGERWFYERGAQSCWFLIKSNNIAGARTARGRLRGRSRHVAELAYWKFLFRTKRRLTLAPPS